MNALIIVGAFGLGLATIAIINKPSSVFQKHPDDRNQMEGKKVTFVYNQNDKKNADGECGHLEAVGKAEHQTSIYDCVWKRMMDVVFSFFALLALSPGMLLLLLLIVIDDPGPPLFTQKRVGKNKRYFKLHKYRSMRLSSPHDVPTHMLNNPEQYITRVGRFIRAHSLDELPQLWDIFLGNMSIVGPRPALWNQDLLTAERDKYGANDVKPGLTGWAQINGRDKISIPLKAKLDGAYAAELRKGGFAAFKMDVKCFLGSFSAFVHDANVIEGKIDKKR